MFTLLLKQTLQLAFRKGGGAFGTCGFYLIVVTLFTFALGPDGMRRFAGAVMCVALLLATITALPLLFERDYEDGTLEQLLLQPTLLELLVLAKLCGQWLAVMLPVLVLSPVLAIMANLSAPEAAKAMLLLLLASPTLIAIGGVAAALTLGSRRGGLLQALIMLPLSTPLLIFAASAGGQGALLLLIGMLCAALPLACILCSALLRLVE